MSRGGFLFASYDIHLAQLARDMIQPVNNHMIHSEICGAQKLVISCHLDTVDMGTKIALRNASKTLVENLIRNLPDSAVPIHTKCGKLGIMVSRHKKKFILVIRG